MLTGILTGLAAAFTQSLSFLGTRHFTHSRPQNAIRQLLIFGHLWMGLFAAIVLVLLWPAGKDWHWVWEVRLPVIQVALFYLLGQIGLALALSFTEPSRVSPLLGLKIIIIAGLSSFLPQPQVTAAAPVVGLTVLQWSGVLLSAVAAIALNFAGIALRKRAIAAILLACITFSFSDWNIGRANVALHQALPGVSGLQLSFLNVGLSFALCALPALVLTPFWGTRKPTDWRDALPFATTWFAGMLFLFWCFAEVGPLLGTILQSTRGVISILLGYLLLRWGHHHMEPLSSRGLLIRRLAAGILMFLAVSLYMLKDLHHLNPGKWLLP